MKTVCYRIGCALLCMFLASCVFAGHQLRVRAVDSSGANIPGALTLVYPPSSSGRPPLLNITDGNGLALFSVDPNIPYSIAVSSHGMFPTLKHQFENSPRTVQLSAAATVLTSTVTLHRDGVLAGWGKIVLTVSGLSAMGVNDNTLVMAEVKNAVTGEQIAFSGASWRLAAPTILIPNVIPASTGSYTLTVHVSTHQISCSVTLTSSVAAGQTCAFTVSTSAFVLSQMVDRQDQPAGILAFEGIVTDMTGAGIKDCTVKLWRKSLLHPSDWGEQTVVAELRTDFSGHFGFYNPASGTYAVSIEKEGYEGFRFEGPYGQGINTTVQPYTRIWGPGPNGSIQLGEAHGVMTGTVKMHVDGQPDMPVPFASVNVNPDGSVWPAVSPAMPTSQNGGYDNYYTTATEHRSAQTEGRTFTDIDGKFTLSGLGHGNYQVSVRSNMVEGQVYFNSGSDGVASVDQYSWGALRTGDDLRVTVSSVNWTTGVYNTASVSQPGFDIYLGTYVPPVGQISGTLTFDVPGDTVNVSSMAPVLVWAYQKKDDKNGPSKNFCKAFSGVLPKTTAYTLLVATGPGMSYYVKPKSYRWASVTNNEYLVNMENQMEVSGKDFKLVPGGTIRGIVRLPDGQLFKKSGSDTMNREMQIEARGITVMTGDGGNVNDDGTFEIMGLAPGSYQLTGNGTLETRPDSSQSWASDSLPWPRAVLTGVDVRARQDTSVEIQLQNGAVVLPKTPAMPSAAKTYTFYGILKFPSATGLTRSEMVALLKGSKSDIIKYVDFYYDPSAGWKQKYILPGRYDFYLARIDLFTAGDNQQSGDIGDHYGVTFINKLPNTEITYDPLSSGVTTYLDFNAGTLGMSTITGAVRGVNIFNARDVQFFKESGIENFFDFIPSLMLYDTQGQLKGYGMALPRLERMGEWMNKINNNLFTAEWFADELSRYPVEYRIERLPAGDYVAVFETPNYPPMMRKVKLTSGVTAFDVNFDSNVITGSGVSGVVTSTAGVALPDVTIVLEHRTMTKSLTTDANGIFTVSGLPPGTWRMTLNKPGYAPAADKFGLGQEPKSFANGNEIVMTKSDALLQGTVYAQKMPSAKVAPGAKIVAYNESYNVTHPDKMLPVLTTKTDERGQFTLDGLISNNIYKVFVISSGKRLEWQTFGTADKPLAVGTTTQAADFVLKTLPARLKVTMAKIYESGRFQYQFLIESPKKIINPSNPTVLAAPYCRYSPVASAAGSFDPAAAVEVLPIIGPEFSDEEGGKRYSYTVKIPVLDDSEFYKMRIEATDGASDYTEDLLFGPKIEAKAKKDIKEELAVGGMIPIDDTGSDATQITLDPGCLTASGAETSSIRQNDVDVPIGGFLSAMPNFNLSRTGSLKSAAMARIKEDIIASDVYEVGLDDAQMNRSLSLSLKFDINAVDDADLNDLIICGYNPRTDAWEPVRGAVTIDPVNGVVSVDVDSLTDAAGGSRAAPSAGRAVVRKGVYTINSAASTSQSGVFAVFKQDPSTAKAFTGAKFSIINFPNPFDLKAKTVTMQDVNADFNQSVTGTMLKYALPASRAGRVVFYIYNLAGELVRELDEGDRNGGFYYYTEWDGRNDNGESCASGVYFLLAKCDGKKLTDKPHKLAILK